MNAAKYFWDLNQDALQEAEKAIKDPQHPEFYKRMITLLSRCDNPKELFSLIPKSIFMNTWPGIRTYWIKHTRRSDSRDWWETIYEHFAEKNQDTIKRTVGGASRYFHRIGMMFKESRITKGLSQKQLALMTGMKQPDISAIEEGKKNITLFTLIRLCKILGIKSIPVL